MVHGSNLNTRQCCITCRCCNSAKWNYKDWYLHKGCKCFVDLLWRRSKSNGRGKGKSMWNMSHTDPFMCRCNKYWPPEPLRVKINSSYKKTLKRGCQNTATRFTYKWQKVLPKTCNPSTNIYFLGVSFWAFWVIHFGSPIRWTEKWKITWLNLCAPTQANVNPNTNRMTGDNFAAIFRRNCRLLPPFEVLSTPLSVINALKTTAGYKK